MPITPRREKAWAADHPIDRDGGWILGLFLIVAVSPLVAIAGCALAVRLGYLDWHIGYGDMLFSGSRMSMGWKLTALEIATGVAGFFIAARRPGKLLGRALGTCC